MVRVVSHHQALPVLVACTGAALKLRATSFAILLGLNITRILAKVDIFSGIFHVLFTCSFVFFNVLLRSNFEATAVSPDILTRAGERCTTTPRSHYNWRQNTFDGHLGTSVLSQNDNAEAP